MDPDNKGNNLLIHTLEDSYRIQNENKIEEINEESLNWERYGTKYYPELKPIAPKVII